MQGVSLVHWDAWLVPLLLRIEVHLDGTRHVFSKKTQELTPDLASVTISYRSVILRNRQPSSTLSSLTIKMYPYKDAEVTR